VNFHSLKCLATNVAGKPVNIAPADNNELGAVVLKDIPVNETWVGNPAKKHIKK
jgi:serine acetyltransferase